MAALDPLPPLLQASCGAVGSAIGNAIVFPLDLVTTRLQHAPSLARKVSVLQMLQRLIRRKGVMHLYSGLGADTLSTLISSFLYFFFYTTLARAALKLHTPAVSRASSAMSANPAGVGGSFEKAAKKASLSGVEELVVGVVAGIASKGITLPISAVCVRQQLESETESAGAGDEGRTRRGAGLLEILGKMYKEEGVGGLFAALPPSIPLALLPSLTLYIHSVLLRSFVPSRYRAHPSGKVTFLLGAVSNALATIPLYPLVLVKALGQSGKGRGDGAGKRSSGVLSTMQTVFFEDGLEGLYKGLQGQLLKGLLSQGVMMLIKQRLEEAVVRAYTPVNR